jgi:hypothetical protein
MYPDFLLLTHLSDIGSRCPPVENEDSGNLPTSLNQGLVRIQNASPSGSFQKLSS